MEQYLFAENCKRKHVSDKDCGELFSKYFDDAKSESLFFLKIKEQKSNLSQGLNEADIIKLLQDSTTIVNDGAPSSVLMKICFSNKKYVHFSMNKIAKEPINVVDIFLPDGSSIFNKIDPKDMNYFLKIPGKIDDPDGYINVRKEASSQSPIIGTIKKGEKFYYTPNSNTNWWKVEKKSQLSDKSLVKGYVYYDRISPVDNNF